MSRDPKAEPRFGDVFTYATDKVHVMFVCRSPGKGWSEGADERWTGLDLEMGGLTDGYSPLRYWTYVESTSEGYASGGFVGPMDFRNLSIAEITKALEAKGFTNIKPIGKSAIQYDEP